MISWLEFICEASHRNLAVTSEQGNLFRVIRMESYSNNSLISLIHNRDFQFLGAEPSFSLLGRKDIRLSQRNLDHVSTTRIEGWRYVYQYRDKRRWDHQGRTRQTARKWKMKNERKWKLPLSSGSEFLSQSNLPWRYWMEIRLSELNPHLPHSHCLLDSLLHGQSHRPLKRNGIGQ